MIWLNSLKVDDAFGFEGLHGVGFELVVAGKTGVETDNALRLPGGNFFDNRVVQFLVQTDEHCALGDAVNCFAGQRE